MRRLEYAMALIVLLSFAVSAYIFPSLPETIAIHWNAQGVADAFSEKGVGVFVLPVITLGVFVLFLLIPRIDPLKANIEKFRLAFEKFAAILLAFLVYVQFVSLWFNLGNAVSMTQALVPGIAILLYAMGALMDNAKRNWFVGIRTPWTVSNDVVWDKTHKLGAPLFKISGAIILL
ncbi:MAG: DUF1648 domain-containing protein, partial [archaeon]|nr:DUF1648 domain-containing protein [archaeon]